LEDQPRPVLGIAESDRPAVVDEDRRHPHPVDVDPAFGAVDRDPLAAAVMQHDLGPYGRAVEADVGCVVVTDDDVAARGKGVPMRTEPDDQEGTGRPIGRHCKPPFAPIILEPSDDCPLAMMR
jgi:hypothetical protein